MAARIRVAPDAIADFCRRWDVDELWLFGSVLRDDFRPESDVDIMARFADDVHWRLKDYIQMEDELRAIVGRGVDLVDRRSVEHSENYIRRKHILSGLERLYVS